MSSFYHTVNIKRIISVAVSVVFLSLAIAIEVHHHNDCNAHASCELCVLAPGFQAVSIDSPAQIVLNLSPLFNVIPALTETKILAFQSISSRSPPVS